MSAVDKLDLCRRYFYVGFAFLPLVWIVNVACFFHCAFLEQSFAIQKQFRKC